MKRIRSAVDVPEETAAELTADEQIDALRQELSDLSDAVTSLEQYAVTDENDVTEEEAAELVARLGDYLSGKSPKDRSIVVFRTMPMAATEAESEGKPRTATAIRAAADNALTVYREVDATLVPRQ